MLPQEEVKHKRRSRLAQALKLYKDILARHPGALLAALHVQTLIAQHVRHLIIQPTSAALDCAGSQFNHALNSLHCFMPSHSLLGREMRARSCSLQVTRSAFLTSPSSQLMIMLRRQRVCSQWRRRRAG